MENDPQKIVHSLKSAPWVGWHYKIQKFDVGK